jgi:hypothetical protein
MGICTNKLFLPSAARFARMEQQGLKVSQHHPIKPPANIRQNILQALELGKSWPGDIKDPCLGQTAAFIA